MKKEWKCDYCRTKCKTKKELIEHLKTEYDQAEEIVNCLEFQWEELGLKNKIWDD